MSPGEIENTIEKVLLTSNGKLAIVQTSRSTPQRHERSFHLISLADILDPSCTTVHAEPLPTTLASRLNLPLGFIPATAMARRSRPHYEFPGTEDNTSEDRILVFLDHQYWVSTYDFGAYQANTTDTPNSDPEQHPYSQQPKRHYVLPRDWLSIDCLSQAIVRKDGALLCPRNGEVAVVCDGLGEEEWVD